MENILKSRIQLKYDTLTNWNSSNLVLKKGEVAIAEVPSAASNSGLTPPAIGIKVGDGQKTFIQLPWIQAVAGDVYDWAKAAVKPTYTADEISGLSAYVSGAIQDTNTNYQIITGTGVNENKYYLQSQESGSSTWTTVSTIDLSNTASRLSALEEWADTNYALAEQIESVVNRKINALDVDDSAISHQFVTGVSESNGKITVSRSTLDAEDITSGTLSVNRGGLGVNTLPSGQVLVGNGTNAVSTKSIDSDVTANSSNLVTSGAVQSYVSQQLASLGNAMHFVGIATKEIINNSAIDPGISGYSVSNAKAGDVIIYNGAEFVWDGSSWQLLGDESSYIIHGAIVNSDIAANANISQSKIANLTTDLGNKVDKEDGKGLSTNDYTTTEKNKLGGIEANAEVNVIEAVKVGGSALEVDSSDKSVTLGTLATKSEVSINELDSALATKLNGITGSLHAIAYDGDVGNLTQESGTILVFDCGNGSDKKYD